jgi:hypothetical protein
MNTPGFTAERSAYKSTRHYFTTAATGIHEGISMAFAAVAKGKAPNCCAMECHGWCQYCWPDGFCSEWFCCSYTCTRQCSPSVSGGVFTLG